MIDAKNNFETEQNNVVPISSETDNLLEQEMAGESDKLKAETKALVEAIKKKAQSEIENAQILKSLANKFPTKLPWGWLSAIAIISSFYGRILAPCPPLFFLMGISGIAIVIAGFEACYRASYTIWAGLWSLTFGTMFIGVGVLASIGKLSAAFTVFHIWSGFYILDFAIRKIIAQIKLSGSNLDGELFSSSLVLSSILFGWIARMVIS